MRYATCNLQHETRNMRRATHTSASPNSMPTLVLPLTSAAVVQHRKEQQQQLTPHGDSMPPVLCTRTYKRACAHMCA